MSEYESKCNYCSKPLPENGEFVNCSACNNNYHYNPCCTLIETSWKAMSIKAKAEWRCRNCKCKLRSNVQALTLSTERASGKMRTRCEEEHSDSNETSAKKYRSDANAILSVKTDVNKMQSNLTQVQDDIHELKKMIADMSRNFNSSMDVLNEKIDALIKEGMEKDKEVDHPEIKVNTLEQKMLVNNVEIVNAPIDKSPLQTVVDIGKALDININENDIDDVFRTKSNKLIVKFASTQKKSIFKKKAKELRNINIDRRKRLFVNDELTATNKHLLWSAKNRAKECSWKYIWIKDGKILAKKDEQSTPIIIRSISDINLLN